MNNYCSIFYLPKPLISKYAEYMQKNKKYPFCRETLDRVTSKLFVFEDQVMHIKNFKEYMDLITNVFSLDTKRISISFNDQEWEKIISLNLDYNIARSNTVKLFISSLFYTHGEIPISVKDFFSYLICNNTDYMYPLFLTKNIYEMYSDYKKNIGHIPLHTLCRAAHFYYQYISPKKLQIEENESVVITNNSTGWKQSCIRGSFALKNFLFEKKRETGKTINCIANNVFHSFLLNAQGYYHG